MKIVFHFDSSRWGGWYGGPIQKLFFRTLLAADAAQEEHLKVFHGDLILDHPPKGLRAQEGLMKTLVGPELPIWAQVEVEPFRRALTGGQVYSLAVDGISVQLRDAIHKTLGAERSYLGAIQLNEAESVHWVLFRQSLIPLGRYYRGEWRIFYSSLDERDEHLPEYFLEMAPFRGVTWEDLGVKFSLFDPYFSFPNARRSEMVGSFFAGDLADMTGQVLLRLDDLDPGLGDVLHAIVVILQHLETSEQAAQVALSCRRYLERLANALVKPEETLPNGRSGGGYKNRLWWYIQQALGSEGEGSTLKQIGARVDQAYKWANSGVHEMEGFDPANAQIWLTELVTLSHDILTLTPPAAPRLEPYRYGLQGVVDALSAEPVAVPRKRVVRSGSPLTEDLALWDVEEATSLNALDIPTEELLAPGYACEFDYAELYDRWGEGVPRRLHAMMETAIKGLSRRRQKGLQRGPFLVWAHAQPVFGAKGLEEEGLLYSVTPAFSERLPANAYEDGKLWEELGEQPGYITVESCHPIVSGALPILWYENGVVRPIRVSDGFVRRMAALFDQANSFGWWTNRYLGILERRREAGSGA